MTFLAEGVTVIERALMAGHQLLSVLADGRDASRLGNALGSGDVPIYAASPAVLEVVCGRPRLRDPIACFVRPELPNARAVLASPTTRTVVVLEGIVNPTNMGVIARCAAGLGIDAMLIDPHCADPLYRRAVRVSMGEVFAIPHARIDEIPGGFDPIRDAGFDLVALSPAPEADDIDEVERIPGDKLAILLGTEGEGLSDAAMDEAGRRVRIPMTPWGRLDQRGISRRSRVSCTARVAGADER